MVMKTAVRMKIYGVLLGLGYLGGGADLSADAASNPHLLNRDTPAKLCQQCHANDVSFSDYKSRSYRRMVFKQNEISMCVNCHTDDASSHSVNISVDFPVPADLPLSADGRITCLTCHKTHGRLRSNRPWASVNFMDRLLNSDRLTKTYLLRRNNANGELCLVCHDHQEKHNHE